MTDILPTGALMWKAGQNHLDYMKPAAAEMNPPLCANKTESTFTSVALDVMDVRMGDLPDPKELGRFTMGYFLAVRCYDQVVDDDKPHTDEDVTTEELNNTPIMYKIASGAGRLVTASHGIEIAMNSASRIIPGTSSGAIRRRDHIQEIIESYAKAVADTANNPDYQKGEILDFKTAMRTQVDVAGYLGATFIDLLSTVLDIPENKSTQKLFEQGSMAMQFMDDIFDWRKDWNSHLAKKEESDRPIRPQENLFNVTLAENPEEQAVCKTLLDDTKKSSMTRAKQAAPLTCRLFSERFNDTINGFPDHPHKIMMQKVNRFLYNKLLPLVSEHGRFNRWAKL